MRSSRGQPQILDAAGQRPKALGIAVKPEIFPPFSSRSCGGSFLPALGEVFDPYTSGCACGEVFHHTCGGKATTGSARRITVPKNAGRTPMNIQQRKPTHTAVELKASEGRARPRKPDLPRVPAYDPYFTTSLPKQQAQREGREHIPFRIYD